jgi:hypothetical protein
MFYPPPEYEEIVYKTFVIAFSGNLSIILISTEIPIVFYLLSTQNPGSSFLLAGYSIIVLYRLRRVKVGT